MTDAQFQRVLAKVCQLVRQCSWEARRKARPLTFRERLILALRGGFAGDGRIWREYQHPRDVKGRFTFAGLSGTLGKYRGFRLTRREKAAVTSAINTIFHAKYAGRTGKVCGMFHGNHYYLFRNRGFDAYVFLLRIPIVGNEYRIRRYEERYKWKRRKTANGQKRTNVC